MESPYKGKTGLIRLRNALFYSFDGLKAAYTCEDAFRQEGWLAVLLIPAAFPLPVTGIGRAGVLVTLINVIMIWVSVLIS